MKKSKSKLPRTIAEALAQGFFVIDGYSQASPDEKTETGFKHLIRDNDDPDFSLIWCDILNGLINIKEISRPNEKIIGIPYTAHLTFGRPVEYKDEHRKK